MSAQTAMLTKMSLATLNPSFKKGHLKALVEASSEPVFTGRLIGSVRAKDVVKTTFGDSIKFIGTFQGYGADGGVSVAPVCYLPAPVDQLLADQINVHTDDKGKLKGNVDFAFDVYAVVDKGESGYKYVVKNLVETKVAEPLAALVGSLGALPKPFALPAPDAAPVLEHQPEVATEAAPEEKATKK